MTSDDRLVGTLSDWLEDQPDRAPAPLLDAVLTDLQQAPQRARWRLAITTSPVFSRLSSPALRYTIVAGFGLLAVVFVLAVWSGGRIGPGAASSPTPSPTPSLMPSARPLPASVPLSAGTYLYDNHAFTTVPFQFTVPNGWVVENGGWNIVKYVDQQEEASVGFASSTLDTINADICTGTKGQLLDSGSSVDDLVQALLEQTGPAAAVEGPFDITVGGYSGQRLDVTSPAAADLDGCEVLGLQMWRDDAGNYWVLLPDWESSIYIVDVEGDLVVLTAQHQQSAPAALVAELEAVMESIVFQP